MFLRMTIAVAIVTASAGAGIAASQLLDIELSPRTATGAPAPAPPTPTTADAQKSADAPPAPYASAAKDAPDSPDPPYPNVELSMRLVDAGGVGIVPDSAAWAAASYSHGTGAFHSLIRPGTAELDATAFERIGRDWRTYVDRMARFGANGIIVGAFLELIDFDHVAGGDAVYPAGGEFRKRHAALRDAFGALFEYARRSGMGVYLKTDMLALTEPLERVLSERADGLDAGDPRLWRVYASGLDELFDRMPDVRGVVVRVGEAGALYNIDGWPYWSEMAVREPAELRLMLETLLPVFERHGRDLVLRSWSVGVGPLGALHTDPIVYDEVLGDIDSPSLVVSTKFTQGDYFGFLPLNPTLEQGPHRRLIEFQARREFEGFSAFPNFLAAEHGRAIRTLTQANPNIAGISLWTQEGGPLHAGPMSIYPLHGYWRWIDANVYATLRLAADPTAPAARPAALAKEWVRANVSTDPAVVETLADVLLRSRAAVEKALYVQPFAEQRASIAGIESTPMMWIMEWDVVGDWSAVSSTVYRASRGRLDEAIADGFDAAREARDMRRDVEALVPRLGGDPHTAAMLRSLAYQESLFEALAWYRKALLTYHEWLDTGEADARREWQASADEFRGAAHAHAAGFGDDLDFPAYDFEPALAGLDRPHRSTLARDAARATLALIALVLIAGAALLRRAAADARGAWMLGVLALVACGMTVTFLFAFEARAVARGLVIVLATFVVALKGGWSGPTLSSRDAYAGAVLGPLLVGAVAALGALAVRGPDHFWFLFWSDGPFRAAAISLGAAMALGVLAAAHTAGRRGAGLATAGALGSTLLATGTALIALSLLLPDLPALLATLDSPLSMLPVRFALVVAATTYAGVPAMAPWYPAIAGVMLAVAGGGLRHLERSRLRRASEHAEALAHDVEGLTADA